MDRREGLRDAAIATGTGCLPRSRFFLGNTQRAQRSKNSIFRSGLKISSENEIFERATHRGPIFCGEIETSRLKFSSEIKNFDRDQKFRSGSNFFDRWALWVGGRKTAQEKKTNSWERRFPGTFRTNVPLILPIFSVFSVGGGPKVPRNFVPGNFFFLSYFRWFFSL